MNGNRLTGKITTVTADNFYVVVCPDAPPHLRTLNLRRSQLAKADLGDDVILEYQVTTHSSLWNVVEVKA